MATLLRKSLLGLVLWALVKAEYSVLCEVTRAELLKDATYTAALGSFMDAVDECRESFAYSCNEPTTCYPDTTALESACAKFDGRIQSFLLSGILGQGTEDTEDDCWFSWDPVYYDCILPECEKREEDIEETLKQATSAGFNSTSSFAQAGYTSTAAEMCGFIQTRFSLTQAFLDDMASQPWRSEKWLKAATCENFIDRNYGRCNGPEGTINLIDMNAYDVQGTVPPLSLIPHVTDLSMHTNKLSGTIPPLYANQQLEKFSLSNNQLEGTLPSLEFNAKLKNLFVYENLLSGELPSFVNNTLLYYLYANDNAFTRTGPPGSCPNCAVEVNGCYLENNDFKYVAPEYTQKVIISNGISAVCNARIGASASTSPHLAALVAMAVATIALF